MTSAPQKSGPTGPGLDEAVLAALFSQSPVGLHVYDPQLRLVQVNTAANFIQAFPVDRMVGRTMEEVLRAFDVEDVESLVGTAREVLATGRPAHGVRLSVRSPRDPRQVRVASVSGLRLRDRDGTVLGLAASIVDVTERDRAEARLELLNRAAGKVGTTLDVFRTAEELCEVVVPEFAGSLVVDVLDAVLRGQAPVAGAGVDRLPLRRAGFRTRAADEFSQGSFSVGEPVGYRVGTPYQRALATLRPVLIRDMGTDASWPDPDRPRDARLIAAGVHSMMAVPMLARGVVLGLARFYRWHIPAPFDHDDLALAEQLTSRTALCVDNARLYGRERSAARIVRRTVREGEVFAQSALETSQAFLPAGAGGAWVDVIPLSGTRVAIAAGDTTAALVNTAAAMCEVRAAITALSELDLLPDELLTRLHDMAGRHTPPHPADQPGAPPEQAVPITCLYAVYDPITRTLRTASAAHSPPVLVHPDGRLEPIDLTPGPPLGQGLAHYTLTDHTLAEHSLLIVHNAALLQTGDGTPRMPLERLREAIATPHASLQDTCDAVLHATAATQPGRDLVLLLARTRVLDAEHTAAWQLPNEQQAAAQARKLATAQLNHWGLDDLADENTLIVSELVTNAVRYATGPIRLRLIRDRALICEVSDDSSTAPHLRRALDTDEGGRGLFITAQLTQRWGVRPAHRGKTIWAEQTLPTPPSP